MSFLDMALDFAEATHRTPKKIQRAPLGMTYGPPAATFTSKGYSCCGHYDVYEG
jgi:hypothetical protein